MIRADDDPPVVQTLMEPGSRFRQLEHRQRASGGKGRNSTSRCPLWPHRRHSMKTVVDPLAIPKSISQRSVLSKPAS
ncbi:MAG TPA: hypothetical protein VGO61_13900 [Steroidobacteraceae bacterium]|jgi:hypothetical protein|nr:hypothetical protein [Steroidobacteraceae bacterium]